MTRPVETMTTRQHADPSECCAACGHASVEHLFGGACLGQTVFGGCFCDGEHVIRTGLGVAACSCGWEFRAPVPRRELSGRETRAAYAAAGRARKQHAAVVSADVAQLMGAV